MKVRDLLRGLLLESGNDAAVTLAKGVAGSERAFVRLMNRRARRARARRTRTTRNPIGLDAPGAHSSARDLVELAPFLRTQAVLPAHRQAGRGHARVRRDAADVREPQHADPGGAVGQRRQDRPHAPAPATCSSARAASAASRSISAVLDEPSKGARNDDTVRLLQLRHGLVPAHHRRADRPAGRRERADPLPPRRRARARRSGRTAQRTVVPRRRRDLVTVVPRRIRARSRARSRSGARARRGRRAAGRPQDRDACRSWRAARSRPPAWRSAPNPGSRRRWA